MTSVVWGSVCKLQARGGPTCLCQSEKISIVPSYWVPLLFMFRTTKTHKIITKKDEIHVKIATNDVGRAGQCLPKMPKLGSKAREERASNDGLSHEGVKCQLKKRTRALQATQKSYKFS